MINGFNLGLGIANFIIATMLWFTVLMTELSIIIFLFILVIANYAFAVWNFSEAFKEIEKEVTNGEDIGKKRH